MVVVVFVSYSRHEATIGHATKTEQSVDQSFDASHSVIWNHEKQRLGAIFNLIRSQTLQWKQTAPYKATRVLYSLFQTNIITWKERSFVYQRSVKRDFMALNQIVNKLGLHCVHSVKQFEVHSIASFLPVKNLWSYVFYMFFDIPSGVINSPFA